MSGQIRNASVEEGLFHHVLRRFGVGAFFEPVASEQILDVEVEGGADFLGDACEVAAGVDIADGTVEVEQEPSDSAINCAGLRLGSIGLRRIAGTR